MAPEQSMEMSTQASIAMHSGPGMMMQQGGHLYMQTNELRNAVVHYRRSPNGAIEEVDRVSTRGPGSGVFKPISGQESAPNAFEGAGSVIVSPDRRYLFATNGGDNSVSSFAVGEDGRLTLLDVEPTGNAVEGRSGTAKSLVYVPSSSTLIVLHSFGPDHLRLMSVGDDGKLTARPEGYTMNTHDKPDRVATMARLSPDEKFLFVGTTFDQPPATNPDGSPILWVEKHGAPHSIASNAPDPDGLGVFHVGDDGTLGQGSFHDGGGASPWYIAFLRGRPDTFVVASTVGDGLLMGKIDEDGRIDLGPLVPLDTSSGQPSEVCWLSVSPDDRTVFATNFGYSNVTSYRINGKGLEIARDPACPKVPGDGTFRALCGDISSGPSDSWICPTGEYFYQIYGNASKLVGYAIQSDGSLSEVTSATIPYNSPQGLAGF